MKDGETSAELAIPTPAAVEPPETASGPDAEVATVEGAAVGASADGMGITASWADLSSSTANRRTPVVPAWLRNERERWATLRNLADNLSYVVRFHAVRTPKYAVKTLWFAPVGMARGVRRVIRWATAEEGNWALRQHAASTNDAFGWGNLNKTRAKESKARWWLVAPAFVALFIAVFTLARSHVVPGWAWTLAVTMLLVAAARVGRPADHPITDRVSTGPKFTKLTADMVRSALLALRLPAMKEPSSVQFAHPGIHRDGPGWLARVNLPEGLESVKVLELRGGLSSALRLPIDQVWPTAGPDHAGQLDLWVGYQPASKLGQPPWSLAAPTAVTNVFDEFEFGSDERQRPVKTCLFERSFLLGGQPGSGKTSGARAILTIAALDPTAELKVAELAGKGDFLDFEPLCSTYICGVDDEALEASAAMLRWGLAEAERRGKRIKEAKRKGLAPDGKVTPELARTPGSGLHPVVMIIDECHELFPAYPEAAQHAERLIKRARALGIILILATQIPDSTSLPPNIVRCASIRWCFSVLGYMENDAILGTGSYKRGITGTMYRPGIDGGWGMMTGLAAPTAVRCHYPGPEVRAAMAAHALAMRGGHAIGADGPEVARDLLRDLAAVAGANGQHWAIAAARLTERWPHAYPDLNGEALSSMARKRDVESVGVKIDGLTLKGYRLPALRKLITGPPDRPAS